MAVCEGLAAPVQFKEKGRSNLPGNYLYAVTDSAGFEERFSSATEAMDALESAGENAMVSKIYIDEEIAEPEPNPAGEIADAAIAVETAAESVADVALETDNPEVAEEVITEVTEGLADAAEVIEDTAQEVEETAQELSEETGDAPAAQAAEAEAGAAANIAEDTEAVADATEAAAEEISEAETASDEPPVTTHWYFRKRGRRNAA